MSCPWRPIRWIPCITLALAIGAVSTTNAATYWEPSITLSTIYDDNIFIRPTLLEDDLILRLTPSLEVGHESRRTVTRVYYSQDMERYNKHPELDSSKIRRFIAGSVLHDISARTVLSLDAGLNESRIPSDLNITTGFGTGRMEGQRTYVNPAIGHRFSSTLSGVVDLMMARDEIDDGPDTNTDQINLEFEQLLSRQNQLLYGYGYSRFEFRGGDIARVHVPYVGLMRRLSENSTLTAVAGPRFSDDDSTGVDASLLYLQQYARGTFMLGYERRATTLIGERGIVEVDAVRSELMIEITPRAQLDFTVGYSRVASDLTVQAGTDVVRAAIHAGYRINQYVALDASWSFTEQNSSGNAIEQFSVPRNVALVSVTFLLPRSSEPGPRERPQARSQTL